MEETLLGIVTSDDTTSASDTKVVVLSTFRVCSSFVLVEE